MTFSLLLLLSLLFPLCTPFVLPATKATPFGGVKIDTALNLARQFVADNAAIQWTFPMTAAGTRELTVQFQSPYGEKEMVLLVNGMESTVTLPQSAVVASLSLGSYPLNAGQNTIRIAKGWGYYDIRSVTVSEPAAAVDVKAAVSLTPSDHLATPQTKQLFSRLREGYGKVILSGAMGAEDTNFLTSAAGGRTVVVKSLDLMDYSPSRVPFQGVPRLVEPFVDSILPTQIPHLLWHWNAPADLVNDPSHLGKDGQPDRTWFKGFYSEATRFDLPAALAGPGLALIDRDIDAIAAQLAKFGGTPILFRPLHEAEGGWFWWGKFGSKPFVALWRHLYNRLAKVHNLHNLIWVFTVARGASLDWYPGDQFVDIISLDGYPAGDANKATMTADWASLTRRYPSKMVGLFEFGAVPNACEMKKAGVMFLVAIPWQGMAKKSSTPQAAAAMSCMMTV